MTRKARIGLVFGGSSVEHEVSLISARGVRAGLEAGPFECVAIGVTEDGRWLPPELSEPVLGGTDTRVVLAPDAGTVPELHVVPGRGELVCVNAAGETVPVSIDVIFPLVHGWGGEDGRMQGLLDLAGIPYVGSGLLGSAIGMDKAISKSLFERRGLPVGPWCEFRGSDYRNDPGPWRSRVAESLGFPVFVKPANGGSSVGISRVDEPGGLHEAVESALGCDVKVVVEKSLDAREIECAVLGNDSPEASVPGEIIPSREFYDYAAKYEDGTSELRIPAPLPPAVDAEVRNLAVKAFRVLDLAGFARVDFFVDRRENRVYLNEVNTLPGFTPISMFPKLWEASGMAYPRLLERLVSLARERWEGSARRATRR